MARVAEESGAIDLTMRRPVHAVAKGYVRFKEGDVIFAKITPCMENGKVAPIIDLPGGCAAGSTEFHVLRPAAVEQRYLWYWLVSRAFRGRAQRSMSGSAGQLRVPVDWLREAEIPVPPLAEQRRIVLALDALFAEIAEGEAALVTTRKGLDTFRRALLKAAVTGELTKDWRAANPVFETGHDLLARIAKYRVGVSAPKARTRRAAEAHSLNISNLPELPDGWTWATVREVADVIGGLTKNPDRERLPIRAPYLRVANVQAGGLDLSDMKEIDVTIDDRQRASLKAGDLLIVEGNGSIDQIGRCAIWNEEIPGCVHQNHIIKARFLEPGFSTWCFTWLLSPHGREQIEKVAASTSGLHTLSISKVEGLPVPVPPPAEIAEILQRVSQALSATTDTRAMLDAEAADAARLKQSVLKAAFEGRLVPQDPADEPASALLARLADEAPTPPKTRSGRQRRAVRALNT
jgi:type I restriction enzyme, S subunit